MNLNGKKKQVLHVKFVSKCTLLLLMSPVPSIAIVELMNDGSLFTYRSFEVWCIVVIPLDAYERDVGLVREHEQLPQ